MAERGERAATVKMVKGDQQYMGRMDGDSLPVSAFASNTRTAPSAEALPPEKRGVAVSVPEWDQTKCISATSAPIICPHATISLCPH